MKVTVICAHVDNTANSWEETFENLPNGWPSDEARKIVDRFNASLRPGEKARTILSVVASGPDAGPKIEHEWDKQNLVTVGGKGGMHDVMKCRRCGATGKRYGLGRVTLDKKFDKLPYSERCPK